MIKPSLLGIQYQIPENPEEAIFGDFIKYLELQDEAPAAFKAYWLEERTEEAVEAFYSPKNQKAIIGHYIKLLQIVLPIETATLEQVPPQQLEALAVRLMKSFLPREKEKQELSRTFFRDGKEWSIPAEFMRGETVGAYLEACDYLNKAEELQAGQWSAMAYIMGVILRPTGEPYKEELVEQRAKYFLSWPLSYAYKVAFFLQRLGRRSRLLSLQYSQAAAISQSQS